VAERAKLAASGIEALGGPAKLTKDQLDSLNKTIQKGLDAFRALGQAAPQALKDVADAVQRQQRALRSTSDDVKETSHSFLEGIPIVEGFVAAFSAEKVLEFGRGLLESISQIETLHKATEVSRGDIQRFGFVGDEFNISLDEMAKGVGQLSERLAGGDASAARAVSSLGLSVKALIAAGPTEAFLQTAEAAGHVADPMQRAALASDLFGGKLAKTLLPALGELRQKFNEVPQNAIISDEVIQKADEFDGKIKHLIQTLKAFAVEAAHAGALGFSHSGVFSDSPVAADVLAEALKRQPVDIPLPKPAAPPDVITNDQLIKNRLDQLRRDALQPLTEATKAQIAALKEWGLNENEIAPLVKASEAAVHRYVGTLTESKEAAKKMAEANKEIESVLEGQFAVFKKLDSNTVDYIETLLKANVSETSIATKFNLTATEVKALSENVKNYTKVLELEAKAALTTAADLETLSKIGTITTPQLDIAAKSFAKIIELERTVGVPDAILKIGIVNPNAERGIVDLTKRVENLKKALDAIKPLDKLAQSFATLAQIGNGSLNGIVRTVGSVVASVSLAEQAFTRLSAGIDESGKKLGNIDKIAGGISGAAGVLSTVSLAFQFAQGLADMFQTPEWNKVMGELSREWGAAISQGTSQGIVDVEKQLAHQNRPDQSRPGQLGNKAPQESQRFAAELINLKPIISDAGGLNSENIDKFTDRLHDVFSVLAQGQITAAQAAKVLDENFQSFVDAGTDKVGLLNSKLVEIVKLNDRVGLQSKEIQKFVAGQVTGNIFTGLSAFSSNATVTSQGSASALTGALGAGIAALQQQGTPLTEILKQVGPIVTNLQAQFDKAGFSGGAAFDLIRREVALASDDIGGPAVTAVNGLGDVLKGLSNIGQLTQEEFTGLGDQAADTFNSLVAQGKDGDAALRLMQPTLQTLYELQQQFGFKVDESTQALIDQGIQNGIVGEKMKSVQQKTLDVLTAIAKALGATLPEEAEKGAQGIKDAFSKLHIDPVHVPIVVDHPEIQVPVPFDPYQPNGAATGGVVMPWGIQRFGGGGRVLPFLARGTDTVPAMLTPGEIVMNAAHQRNVADQLAARGGMELHFHSVFPPSPTQLRRTLDEYVGPWLTDAYHRDINGVRKVIKKISNER
jgi:predicted transcriptional regulator